MLHMLPFKNKKGSWQIGKLFFPWVLATFDCMWIMSASFLLLYFSFSHRLSWQSIEWIDELALVFPTARWMNVFFSLAVFELWGDKIQKMQIQRVFAYSPSTVIRKNKVGIRSYIHNFYVFKEIIHVIAGCSVCNHSSRSNCSKIFWLKCVANYGLHSAVTKHFEKINYFCIWQLGNETQQPALFLQNHPHAALMFVAYSLFTDVAIVTSKTTLDASSTFANNQCI